MAGSTAQCRLERSRDMGNLRRGYDLDIEGGAGTKNKLVKFQLRPSPLAD